MKNLSVPIPGYEYSIQIGSGVLKEKLLRVVQEHASELVVVVTNATIHELYPDYLQECLGDLENGIETCILPDGERYKTIETLNLIYDFLFEKHANRNTLLVAFGGGVIGDMTGFAAATFMRGIPFVQVPTTLLSQVDSSVGGKTAVNHPLGKNSIGAFKQPEAVIMELDLLKTLSPRELKAGYFELIKHGIIHDSDLFDFLADHPTILEDQVMSSLEEAVYRSCQVKSRVVTEDEKEKGLRATLNFGHTLGHLIETHTNYEKYLHGEAVGTGMAFGAYFSWKLGFLKEETYLHIIDVLAPFLTPIELPPLGFDTFRSLILHDKKSSQAGVNYILLSAIGTCFIQKETTPDQVWNHFNEFIEIHPNICKILN